MIQVVGRYILSRTIAADPDRVFEAFTDAALVKDWMNLQDVTNITGPLGTAGSRYTLVVRGPWKLRSETVRSDRPRVHRLAGRGPLGASFAIEATLTPDDETTHLELLTEYSPPLGPIGRLLDRIFLEGGPRSTANRELDRLVKLVS